MTTSGSTPASNDRKFGALKDGVRDAKVVVFDERAPGVIFAKGKEWCEGKGSVVDGKDALAAADGGRLRHMRTSSPIRRQPQKQAVALDQTAAPKPDEISRAARIARRCRFVTGPRGGHLKGTPARSPAFFRDGSHPWSPCHSASLNKCHRRRLLSQFLRHLPEHEPMASAMNVASRMRSAGMRMSHSTKGPGFEALDEMRGLLLVRKQEYKYKDDQVHGVKAKGQAATRIKGLQEFWRSLRETVGNCAELGDVNSVRFSICHVKLLRIAQLEEGLDKARDFYDGYYRYLFPGPTSWLIGQIKCQVSRFKIQLLDGIACSDFLNRKYNINDPKFSPSDSKCLFGLSSICAHFPSSAPPLGVHVQFPCLVFARPPNFSRRQLPTRENQFDAFPVNHHRNLFKNEDQGRLYCNVCVLDDAIAESDVRLINGVA
ncbi:hypothetical protein B0H19DRAFT_1083684 [Mycena capillaripes]|nr:hypothetical protein B0H19DRAFT_1083684 [Mycena capillaripes]